MDNIRYSIGTTKNIPCSKECDGRYPGCHAECERYISWKSEHLEKKEAIFENMKTQSEATAFFKSMSKAHKKRKGKTKW